MNTLAARTVGVNIWAEILENNKKNSRLKDNFSFLIKDVYHLKVYYENRRIITEFISYIITPATLLPDVILFLWAHLISFRNGVLLIKCKTVISSGFFLNQIFFSFNSQATAGKHETVDRTHSDNSDLFTSASVFDHPDGYCFCAAFCCVSLLLCSAGEFGLYK